MTIFEYVEKYPGKTSSELAEIIGKGQNIVSGGLASLEKRGKVIATRLARRKGLLYFPAEFFKASKEIKTVGDLRRALNEWEWLPDEFVLVTTNDNADAVDVTSINTLWHGALTFEHN